MLIKVRLTMNVAYHNLNIIFFYAVHKSILLINYWHNNRNMRNYFHRLLLIVMKTLHYVTKQIIIYIHKVHCRGVI